ncbi:MAG TPA: hypothetical protein VJV58_07990, partial [Bradyrhizobium sp.]|uniref:hypothetical protein n=1 Tax=Bradyrhizobium sp. TaxID=376 RepID=UPI002B46AA98
SPLPVTNKLGEHVLGLPFWLGLEHDDIIAIVSVLEEAIASARGTKKAPRATHRSMEVPEPHDGTLKLAP